MFFMLFLRGLHAPNSLDTCTRGTTPRKTGTNGNKARRFRGREGRLRAEERPRQDAVVSCGLLREGTYPPNYTSITTRTENWLAFSPDRRVAAAPLFLVDRGLPAPVSSIVVYRPARLVAPAGQVVTRPLLSGRSEDSRFRSADLWDR